MKPDTMNTTNYFNTFIAVADDCPVDIAQIPPDKNNTPTAATVQFQMMSSHPYRYDSDSVLFEVYAVKSEITEGERKQARETFFSKGQPCMRASPLTKRYGWGVHCNKDGKVAIYAVESPEYAKLSHDRTLKQLKAMRNAK